MNCASVMDSALRKQMKCQIQACLLKNPDWTPVEVRRWVMNDNAVVKDVQINQKTLIRFITYQIVKFRQGLDVQEHRGGNGRPSISMQKRRQVLKLAINKETPGLRAIAQKTGVSYSSARRILHQAMPHPTTNTKRKSLVKTTRPDV